MLLFLILLVDLGELVQTVVDQFDPDKVVLAISIWPRGVENDPSP